MADPCQCMAKTTTIQLIKINEKNHYNPTNKNKWKKKKRKSVAMVAQSYKHTKDQELLGGPVVRTPKFMTEGVGSISGWWTKIWKSCGQK